MFLLVRARISIRMDETKPILIVSFCKITSLSRRRLNSPHSGLQNPVSFWSKKKPSVQLLLSRLGLDKLVMLLPKGVACVVKVSPGVESVVAGYVKQRKSIVSIKISYHS